jgi:hypothetical protein
MSQWQSRDSTQCLCDAESCVLHCCFTSLFMLLLNITQEEDTFFFCDGGGDRRFL